MAAQAMGVATASEVVKGAPAMSTRNRLGRAGWILASLALAIFLVFWMTGIPAGAGAHDATAEAHDTTHEPTPEAHDATHEAGTTTATITVTGTGIVALPPDAASITLGVTITAATLKEAQATASDQMSAVIAELNAGGVAEADIQTTNFSVYVNQSYDANGVAGKVTGYTVNNQVTVTVRDLATLGTLLDRVVEKGANSIWGITFFVADQTEAIKAARELAVSDAMTRAAQIAAAAHGSVGPILAITEVPAATEFGITADGKGGASSPPIQSGGTTVSASVTITFAFVP
jgi:uncharacterized protein YggE